MDLEEAVKTGFLLVPPQSFLRKTWLKWYCAVYNASNRGIQRIELFESEDAFVKQNPCKIVPLTDCIKVSPAPQKQQANVFEVRTKSNTYQFSADTFQDMTDWLTSFQRVAFGRKVSKVSASVPPYTKEEKQEENMLYSSMEEPEVYPVKAVPTEAILRNKLVGDYKLIITSVNLSIAEEAPQGRMGRIILTWPYRHIRRYGCTTENFSFEAGRKCVSGEGLFTFSTSDGMLIFQSVDAHVVALKSSQHESDMPNSPSLNEGKCFFSSKDSLANKAFSHADKFDQLPNAKPGNNETLAFQSKASQKPSPPVAKPPRKSKPTKATYNSSNISHNKASQNDDSAFSPNLYEELFRGTHPDLCRATSDSGYQTYNPEEVNLSLPDEKSLCYRAEKLQICDMPKQDSSNFSSVDSPFLQGGYVAAPKPIDHVYGKIINTKQMPAEDTYGKILPKSEKNSSPMYSNVPFFTTSGSGRRDPDHFVKNDAEYAQVFKKE